MYRTIKVLDGRYHCIRSIAHFLRQVFSSSVAIDAGSLLATCSSHRLLMTHHLYYMLALEFPQFQDTAKILVFCLKECNTETLRILVNDVGFRRKFLTEHGIVNYSNKLQWRWLTAHCLLFLDPRNIALLSTVCRRWNHLVSSRRVMDDRNSIFRESIRSVGLTTSSRIAFWRRELLSWTSNGKLDGSIYEEVKCSSSDIAEHYIAASVLVDQLSESSAALIDEDVRRTFGANASDDAMRTEERQTRLRSVLRCYAANNELIGYCQGLDYITSFLLENCGWNEAMSYHILELLMERRKLKDLFRVGLPHLQVAFRQFNVLMAMHMPDLAMHFEREEIDVSMFGTSWFMTLYTDSKFLPKHVVVRVFDAFVLDGWSVMMSVSLALLKSFEKRLLAMNMEEILHFFKRISDHQNMLLKPDTFKEIHFDATRLLAAASEFGVSRRLLCSIEESMYTDAERQNKIERRVLAEKAVVELWDELLSRTMDDVKCVCRKPCSIQLPVEDCEEENIPSAATAAKVSTTASALADSITSWFRRGRSISTLGNGTPFEDTAYRSRESLRFNSTG